MTPRPYHGAAGPAPTPWLTTACALGLALWLPAAHRGQQMDTGPLPVVERVAAPPTALPCRVQPGERGSVVQLGNDTEAALPRGARIAWAATGTPAAQGQWHWLAHPLAPGQGLSIALTTALRGSGCVATWLH